MSESSATDILAQAQNEIVACQTPEQVEAFRVKYLGKKGIVTGILKGLADVAPDQRRILGQQANELRAQVEQLLADTAIDDRWYSLKVSNSQSTILCRASAIPTASFIRSPKRSMKSQISFTEWVLK